MTPNHLLFRATVGDFVRDIRLRDVEDLQKTKTGLVFDTAMSIKLKGVDERVYFGSFVTPGHRNEALALAQHLLENPVSFVAQEDEEEDERAVVHRGAGMGFEGLGLTKSNSAPTKNSNPFGQSNNPFERTGSATTASTRHESTSSMGSGQMQIQEDARLAALVDTQTSARALQRTHEAMATGTATLEEMQRQRDVLDRTERKLDQMDSNLDSANHHLRAIESVGGAFYNKVVGGPKQLALAEHSSARVEQVKLDEKLEIPVVHKLEDDSLHQATICFFLERFEIAKGAWFYRDVQDVVVRSRPLHLDIHFKGLPRVRFVTAHVQRVVNELWLRTQRTLVVTFEPSPMKPFPYKFGARKLVESMRASASSSANPFMVRTSTFSNAAPSAFVAGQKDGALKEALLLQEGHVDAMGDNIKVLHEMALTIGKTADEDIQQIGRISNKTDHVQTKLDHTNSRVEQQNLKW